MCNNGDKPRNRTSLFETLYRISQAEKILDNLKIEWELDLNKMNLRELRDSGFGFIKNYMPVIGSRRIDSWYDGTEGDLKAIFHPNDADIMLDLIEFVQTGKKIIPPLAVIPVHIIDGEKTTFESVILDGVHRIRLARRLGHSEVPLVLYEYTKKYAFSKSNWKVERTPTGHKATRLNGFAKYSFKAVEWKYNKNEQEYYWFYR